MDYAEVVKQYLEWEKVAPRVRIINSCSSLLSHQQLELISVADATASMRKIWRLNIQIQLIIFGKVLVLFSASLN